ncbi:hypothetical protein [Novosphingobium rosa]|uniref:hypothetical protein n=1 Tax=Novosphingobium rosa TaxID=76978 RepID=UPI000B20AF8B|nr:hypothetical protein [Novosphingobium rosa]
MQTPQFDSPVALWEQMPDRFGVDRSMCQEGEWTLGEAIGYVISQPVEEQWRFKIVSGRQSIDHLAMMRLASNSLFRNWDFD